MNETVKNVEINEVNGVDVNRLQETICAIQEQPQLAEFHFYNSNEWIDGGHNRSSIRPFYGAGQEWTERSQTFVFDADEPDVLLGGDKGANPVEYLLHALAGCMTTTMVYHAAARGISIRRIESSYEGDIDLQGLLGLDEKVRPGYQNIRVKFNIDSDGTEEELKELVKYSPVFNSVSEPVKIDVEIKMV